MRTTITLDDDVAAQLEKLGRAQDRTFKELVNTALREGLSQMGAKRAPARARFRTKPLKLGACRVGTVDDVSEVLAIAEGELYR